MFDSCRPHWFAIFAALLLATGTRFSDGHRVHDSHDGHSHHQHGRHHKCVHSDLIEPRIEKMMKKITDTPLEAHRFANHYEEVPPMRKLLSDSDEPAPMRINVDYQLDNLEATEPEKAKFLKESLIPAMVGVFQRSFKVKKPVNGPLKLPHFCSLVFSQFPQYCLEVLDTCGTAKHNREFLADWRTCEAPYDDSCTSHEGGGGSPETDFVLYVTAEVDDGCLEPFNAIASGGFCLFDMDNWYGSPNRPLAGVANFCPGQISTKPEEFGFMLDTAVHEVLHATLMSRRLIDNYIDEFGNKRVNSIVTEGTQTKVVTPNVQKAVQDSLQCGELTGASLEDEGGDGTAGSHWESRIFMGEIMVGNSMAASRDTLSNITMALAEDSGWYVPNYDKAGVLTSSHEMGCEFATKDCTVPSLALSKAFCWKDDRGEEQASECTPDHRSIGYCRGGMKLLGGCRVITAYQNTDCTNPEHDRSRGAKTSLAVDMGTRHKPGARCFPVKSNQLVRSNNFYVSSLGGSAACFDAVCKDGDLFVRIPGSNGQDVVEFACEEGEFIDLAAAGIGFTKGVLGPCPAANDVCRSWGCPDDCHGNGQCFLGQCTCHVGFVGEDCKNRACTVDSCSGGKGCDLMTGLCEGDEPAPTKPSMPKGPKSPAEIKKPLTEKVPKKEPEKKDDTEVVVETEEPIKSKPDESPEEVENDEPVKGPPEEDEIDSNFPTTPSVPTIEEEEDSEKGVFISGRAVWNGYLEDCAVFGDINGNMEWDSGEPGVLTARFGKWGFEAPEGVEIVLDPFWGSSCRDIFGTRPRWPLRAPWGSKSISPITTLAVSSRRTAAVSSLKGGVDSPDEGATIEGTIVVAVSATDVQGGNITGGNKLLEQEVSEVQEIWVDDQLLSALMLDELEVIEKDVLGLVGRDGDVDSERAVVVATVLANTVTQISAFVSGMTEDLVEEAASVVEILGRQLGRDSFEIGDLATPKGVRKIIDLAYDGQRDTPPSKALNAVAATIAETNEDAFESRKSLDGVPLLEDLARLAQVAQGNFAQRGADLSNQEIAVSEYLQETDAVSLQESKMVAEVSEIDRAVGVDANPQKKFVGLDFKYSGPALFGGVLCIFVIFLLSVWCCCRK
ncbi:hypothetical protein BSKO_08273 [Bryopsis sp. KO-2023]|nr:hypothetical protein BSKO_08273 [Bryopsis sp. KO-2023]